MEGKYRKTAATVSLVNYHFVFCSRRRRKIFKVAGVEERFRSIVSQVCERNQIEILALDCDVDHCHLFVNAPPSMSPAEIMKLVKHESGAVIKEECFTGATTQVWTRNYFVSTAADISDETISWYVDTQKTR